MSRLQPNLTAWPLLLALSTALLIGCGDADIVPGTSSRVPTATRAGEQVPGLWRPAAVAVGPDAQRAWIAEIATRRVREVDLATGAMRTVLDVEPRPDAASIAGLEMRWDMGWGRALLWLDDGHLLLGGVGRPLVVLDPEGVDAPIAIGHGRDQPGGVAPAPGVALQDVDLATLQGLAVVEGTDELVVVLGARLWRATPGAGATSALRLASATLEPLAGDGRRGVGPDVGDALEVPLDLVAGRWEAVLAHPDGRVFFVETYRLRLVEDARIVSITGDGTLTGLAPIPLVAFSPMFASGVFSLGVWIDGAPHLLDGSVVRRFEIDSVDLGTGAVEGRVVALHGGVPELGGAAAVGGRLWITFGLGGALIELVDQDPGDDSELRDLVPVVGPMQDYAERYRFLYDDYTLWRLDGLVLPQSVVALSGGEVLLVNQPLARLMSAVERLVEPGAVPPGAAPMRDPDAGQDAPPVGSSCIAPDGALASCAFWADSKGGSLGLGPSASDNQRFLYTVFRGQLTRYDAAVAEDTLPVVTTTRAPVASGIPAAARDVVLITPAQLIAAGDDVLLALPGAVARYEPATGRIEHETGPSSGISPLNDEKVPLFALDMRERAAFDAAPGGVRLAAVDDPQLPGMLIAAGAVGDPVTVAGVEVGRRAYHRVVGGGSAALADGVTASDVWLEAVDAVALVDRPDSTHAVLAMVHGRDASGEDIERLVHVGADGLVERVAGACAQPPVALGWLHAVLDDEGALVAVVAQERAAPGVARALLACRVGGDGPPVALGDTVLAADTWTTLDGATSTLEPSVSGATLVHHQTWRGLPVVWLHTLALGDATRRRPQRVDLALGAAERVESIALRRDGGHLLVAVDGPDGRLLLDGRLAGHDDATLADVPVLPSLAWIGGGGVGLSGGQAAQSTAMGDAFESLAVGPDGDLLVVASDTRSVWRVEAGGDGADGSDPAHLLWTGAPIFTRDDEAHPSAIGEGGRVWVGGRDGVFEIVDGQPRRVVGGAGPLFDGAPAHEAAVGAVLGLAAEGSTCYVLTERALFAVVEPDGRSARIRMLSDEDGTVEVDGERWALGARVVAQPLMSVGRPDELLVVVPGRHTVVSVSTAGLER